ncbi:MAG: hypothetical protein QOE70_4745 [Chthoniobacter sp.]|nr:hypothetical protein [Chthoniobacter sp.]
MAFTLPKCGFVFWPVGTGDSTTIVVKANEVIVQVDLHHLGKSDDKETPHVPIVDELVRLLPKRNGQPYLSVFMLTHPDKDHILGFRDLLSRVTIGELWHTPRIFREYKKDFCDDAQAFRDEARRRRGVTIEKKGAVGAGDRVRVIGHDEGTFQREAYKGFPYEWRAFPGKSITKLDGTDYAGTFEAFIHAPFKNDSADTRNNTSHALQIALTNGLGVGKALLFGDREYPTVNQIFTKTKEREREQYLEWNVALAPHHCSKKVMFWKDEGQQSESFRQNVMKAYADAALPGAYIVASCDANFGDGEGRNPPHLSARLRYEEIVSTGHFLCTHEIPNQTKPEPIKFEVGEKGFSYEKPSALAAAISAGVAAAVAAARGTGAPPQTQVGFGDLP